MRRVLLLVLVVAAGFVWLTSGDLPPVVASHFGSGGAANGFMGKGTYTAFMLAVVVAVPALIGFSGQLVRVLPLQLVNLPNKQYWLAPQRKAATLESLSSLSVPFALALVVFLCFVHWLVVQANAVQPARLPEGSLFVGLAVFGVATVLWLVVLFRRFGRVP
jgi:uncharacterized membrane protein